MIKKRAHLITAATVLLLICTAVPVTAKDVTESSDDPAITQESAPLESPVTVGTGWIQSQDGNWYYAKNGAFVRADWAKISNKWYYFDENGIMLTGIRDIDGDSYIFSSSGAMLTGWQASGGGWYYFKPNGIMVKSAWEGNYYLASDGMMLTNCITPDFYYVDANGKYTTGWVTIDNAWYYFGKKLVTDGWKKIGSKWYYFDKDGVMQTGRLELNGDVYYLNNSGAMLTGWQKINDTWFYFASSGELKKCAWVDTNYYVDKDGQMVSYAYVKNGAKYYWVNALGKYTKTYAEAEDGYIVYDQATGDRL